MDPFWQDGARKACNWLSALGSMAQTLDGLQARAWAEDAVGERDKTAGVGVERKSKEAAKGPRPPKKGSTEKGRMEVPAEVSLWMSIWPMQYLVSQPENLEALTDR